MSCIPRLLLQNSMVTIMLNAILMKQNYFSLLFTLALSSFAVNAQTVNQIYDHDSTDLNQLENMPFDASRLLVVSGFSFSSDGYRFRELDQSSGQLIDLPINNVDTLLSAPVSQGDKLFFEASINGMGREIAAYDGTSTYFFDLNTGTGNSDPEIFSFENELYAIAYDGTLRQLFKFTGTSFQQISEETEDDVTDFIANRGNEYYYITFSNLNGRAIKSTVDNSGALTHSTISPTSFQEALGDVVLLNGDIYFVSYVYTVTDASYRVDKIDASNMITTHHFETGGQFSSSHLLAYNNDILFYLTEPGLAEILNVSVPQQPLIQVSIDPAQYNLIGGHVVHNGKLFIYGDQYVMDVSGTTPVALIEDASTIRLTPAYETSSAFYLYELAQPLSGGPSGIIEVTSTTNQLIAYDVSNDAGFFFHTSPMVENNGELKFIFKTETGTPSTDIYSLTSIATIPDNLQEDFALFPNPSTNGDFSIRLPKSGDVRITTLEGQLVKTMHLEEGTNHVQVDELSAGIYLIEYLGNVQRLVVN